MLKLQSDSGLHLRMRAFTEMFVTFLAAFGEPVTAIVLTVVCTALVAVK
ncbi:hypothetical protein [Marinobacterium stanieri]|nr:hypothetical protein [Marinobacterium stanieri]